MQLSNEEGRALLAKQGKKKGNQESVMQSQFVAWFRLKYPQYAKLLTAIPNGGKRDIITASILKREGVTAGWPDILMAVPRNGFFGLFMEMKVEAGKVSAKQEEMIHLLIEQGYQAVVVWSFEEAQWTVLNYLQEESKNATKNTFIL